LPTGDQPLGRLRSNKTARRLVILRVEQPRWEARRPLAV